MYILSLVALLAAAPVPARAEPAAPADTLTCRVVVEQRAPRRCAVSIPAGRQLRACPAAEPRCKKTPDGGRAAWVVATGGASCKISKKRTDWQKTVTLSMKTKKGTPPGSACELRVALR